MNSTIKLKNVRVPDPGYSPGVARFSFAVACFCELLVLLDII